MTPTCSKGLSEIGRPTASQYAKGQGKSHAAYIWPNGNDCCYDRRIRAGTWLRRADTGISPRKITRNKTKDRPHPIIKNSTASPPRIYLTRNKQAVLPQSIAQGLVAELLAKIAREIRADEQARAREKHPNTNTFPRKGHIARTKHTYSSSLSPTAVCTTRSTRKKEETKNVRDTCFRLRLVVAADGTARYIYSMHNRKIATLWPFAASSECLEKKQAPQKAVSSVAQKTKNMDLSRLKMITRHSTRRHPGYYPHPFP